MFDVKTIFVSLLLMLLVNNGIAQSAISPSPADIACSPPLFYSGYRHETGLPQGHGAIAYSAHAEMCYVAFGHDPSASALSFEQKVKTMCRDAGNQDCIIYARDWFVVANSPTANLDGMSAAFAIQEYRTGIKLMKAGDCAGAYTAFVKAEEGNVLCAEDEAGVILSRGCPAAGLARDFQAARAKFESAAQNGCAIAYTNLGDIYLQGLGVQKDRDKASNYYIAGVHLQEPNALKRLNRLIAAGEARIAADEARIANADASIAAMDAQLDAQAVANEQQFIQPPAPRPALNVYRAPPPVAPVAAPSTFQPIRIPSATLRAMPTTPMPTQAGISSGGCSSDFECGSGRVCLRASGQVGLQGVCATPVDRSGVPQFPMQRDHPTRVAGCNVDVDCAVGFRCLKQPNEIKGVCAR